MRIPISQCQKGVVYNIDWSGGQGKTYYFVADHEWYYRFAIKRHTPARLMTYAEYKKEFPHPAKYGSGRTKTKVK